MARDCRRRDADGFPDFDTFSLIGFPTVTPKRSQLLYRLSYGPTPRPLRTMTHSRNQTSFALTKCVIWDATTARIDQVRVCNHSQGLLNAIAKFLKEPSRALANRARIEGSSVRIQ